MINHFCLLNMNLIENSLFGSPSDFKVCQSSFGLAIFSDNFYSKYCFFLCSLVLWTWFLASLQISQPMLRQLDLNFLNSLSLMLNFPAISLSNHSLLVFFILIVFEGEILLNTSINFWKQLLYALFILYFS